MLCAFVIVGFREIRQGFREYLRHFLVSEMLEEYWRRRNHVGEAAGRWGRHAVAAGRAALIDRVYHADESRMQCSRLTMRTVLNGQEAFPGDCLSSRRSQEDYGLIACVKVRGNDLISKVMIFTSADISLMPEAGVAPYCHQHVALFLGVLFVYTKPMSTMLNNSLASYGHYDLTA